MIFEIKKLNQRIDINGELPLKYRCELFNSGRTDYMSKIVETLFIKSEIQCALYTKPIWDIHFDPNDDLFAYLLYEINDVTIHEKMIASFQTHLNDKFGDNVDEFPAIYAGFAALSALHAKIYGISSISIADSEYDIDATEWSSAYNSSIAYCGKATWEANPDNAKRRQFWDWYINDCLVKIYKEIT